MRQRKASKVATTKFARYPELAIDNFVIEQGEIIKVKGENGLRFKFHSVVTNTETGSQWVDCFEMWRGTVGVHRSFRIEKIKRIPKKRVKRAKSVSRRAASTTS
jgi:hypothetical protein